MPTHPVQRSSRSVTPSSLDASPVANLIATSPEQNRRWFDGPQPRQNSTFSPTSTLSRRSHTRSHIRINNGDDYVHRGPNDTITDDESVQTKTSMFSELDRMNPLVRPFVRVKRILKKEDNKPLELSDDMYQKSNTCFGLSCQRIQSNILFSDWKKAKIRSLSKRIYQARRLHRRHIIIEKLKDKTRRGYGVLKEKAMRMQNDAGVSHEALTWERQELENIENALNRLSAKTHHSMLRLRRLNSNMMHWLCGKTQKKASTFAWNDLDAEDRTFVKSVILDVGFCLSLYNIPAYRLEETLIFLAATYGLDLDLQVTPTSFLISFHDFLVDKQLSDDLESKTTDLAALELKLIHLMDVIENQRTDAEVVAASAVQEVEIVDTVADNASEKGSSVSGNLNLSVRGSTPSTHRIDTDGTIRTEPLTSTGTEHTPISPVTHQSQRTKSATISERTVIVQSGRNPLSGWQELPNSPARAPIIDETTLRQRRRSHSLPPLVQPNSAHTPTYTSISMHPDPYHTTFGQAVDSPLTHDVVLEDAGLERISPITEGNSDPLKMPRESPTPSTTTESVRLHVNSPVAVEYRSHRSGEPVIRMSNNEDRAAAPNPVEEIVREENEENKKRLLPSEMYLLGNTTHFVTIPSQSLNLTKIILLERLAEHLQESTIELKDAHDEMRKILSFRPLSDAYPFQFVASLLACTAFAVFLDGNRIEILATFVASLLIVLADSALSFTPNLKRLYISIAAMIGGGVALVFKQLFKETEYPVNTFLVALASIVSFLPGLGITVAFAELSERKIQSGILRLMESLVNIFRLSIGILMTDSLERIFFPDHYGNLQPEYANPSWAYAIAVVCACVGFGIEFRAPFYFLSWFFTITASFAAFFSSQYLRNEVGKELATVLGAVILGIFSQVYARITGHPALVVSSVSILLMVPGSLMLRSIQTQFVGNDTSAALAFIFETGITAVSLTIGLSISKILVPSNRTLNLI